MSLCRLIFADSEPVLLVRSHAPHAFLPPIRVLLVCATFFLALSSCYFLCFTGGVAEASTSSTDRDTSTVGVLVEVKETRQPVQEPGPLGTFAAIEQAWNMGWVDSIITFFPEGKINLRLDKNVPESASFTQKQASYMLRDSFRYRITESFEFLEFKYKAGGSHPTSGKAKWSFRKEPTGKIIVAKVQVTLRKEGERWLISGIRIQD